MSLKEVEEAGKDLKIKIMSMEEVPMNQRMENIKKLESYIMVLSHPARRLTYDSFGETDT